MAHVIDQPELDAPGFETVAEQRRRKRTELLRRAGVQPARSPEVLMRADRRTVKPYPKWVLRLAKLIP